MMPLDFDEIVEHGSLETVKNYLAEGNPIDAKDCIGCTLLFCAVSEEQYEIAQYLLECGANVDIPEVNGITPLMDAASGGSDKMVTLLLDFGADLSLSDNFDCDAFEYAKSQKMYSTLELLERHRA